jgi:hypothetical protein
LLKRSARRPVPWSDTNGIGVAAPTRKAALGAGIEHLRHPAGFSILK